MYVLMKMFLFGWLVDAFTKLRRVFSIITIIVRLCIAYILNAILNVPYEICCYDYLFSKNPLTNNLPTFSKMIRFCVPFRSRKKVKKKQIAFKSTYLCR